MSYATAAAASIHKVAATAVALLAAGQNVVIEVTQPGIGVLTALQAALIVEPIPTAVYSVSGLEATDIHGLPYLENGEVKVATPIFTGSFDEDQVIVLDEVNHAIPEVAAFIRSQAARGRVLLIVRKYHDKPACGDLYEDFPAVRLQAQAPVLTLNEIPERLRPFTI